MENNRTIKGLQFIVTLLFTFVLTQSVVGQDFKKYYKSQKKEESTLYFIPSNISFKSSTSGNHLTYDITYRTDWDSVIINISFFSKSIFDISQIILDNTTSKVSLETNKMFVEKGKKYWHNRYSIRIEKSIYSSLFLGENKINIQTCNPNLCETLTTKQKDWEHHILINQHINDLILLNKQ